MTKPNISNYKIFEMFYDISVNILIVNVTPILPEELLNNLNRSLICIHNAKPVS